MNQRYSDNNHEPKQQWYTTNTGTGEIENRNKRNQMQIPNVNEYQQMQASDVNKHEELQNWTKQA